MNFVSFSPTRYEWTAQFRVSGGEAFVPFAARTGRIPSQRTACSRGRASRRRGPIAAGWWKIQDQQSEGLESLFRAAQESDLIIDDYALRRSQCHRRTDADVVPVVQRGKSIDVAGRRQGWIDAINALAKRRGIGRFKGLAR